MALQLDTIRATADRVAASHHLAVVDLEFSGGIKFRTLRVFIEKDAETRARLANLAAEAEAGQPLDPLEPIPALPANVPVALLSFTTHEDCEAFARDFGTVLDIEDLIPGADYTLEVSSPGLERKLATPADFTRFTGSLVKLQTFTVLDAAGGREPGKATRHFQGRLTAFTGDTVTLDLAAVKPKGKPKKSALAPESHTIDIAFPNIEKASIIPEI